MIDAPPVEHIEFMVELSALLQKYRAQVYMLQTAVGQEGYTGMVEITLHPDPQSLSPGLSVQYKPFLSDLMAGKELLN